MGAQGHGTIDLGVFPGTGGEKRVAVTGQAGILAGSDVEVSLRCESSADHSADEHFVENVRIRAGNITAGTGFEAALEVILGTAYGVWNYTWVWN